MALTRSGTDVLALAFLDGAEDWRWYLKIDPVGLYRWYLQGDIWTNLGGVTPLDAENNLRRFVRHSLRGELVLVDTPDRYPSTHPH
jgi:hypothetical protein